VIRAFSHALNVPGSRQIVCEIFQTPSPLTQQEVGTQLLSELNGEGGKEREWQLTAVIPPLNLSSPTATSPHGH